MPEEPGPIPVALEEEEHTEPHSAYPPLDRAQTRADTQVSVVDRQDTDADGDTQTQASFTRMQTSDPFSLRGIRSPLVGREVELSEMRKAIDEAATQGKPQLITIVGNQGTGKSRLADELLQGLPQNTIAYRCQAVADGAPYSTIAKILRNRFALTDVASEEELAAAFRREVQEVFGDLRVAEVLHVLGRFLNLRFPDSPFLRVLTDSPAQYDELSRTVLKRFLEVDAQKGPILLLIDGLELADKASLSFLQELSSGLSEVPVTLVVCTRPELMVHTATWGQGVNHHLQVELRNLPPEDSEQMFRQLLSRCEHIPDEIAEDAVEMTGGNPHFVDQLVRLFLANGTINDRVSPWQIDAERASRTDLLITVEEAIEARIASLAGGERDVLEKGAVFGNVFWQGSIVALSRMEQEANADDSDVSEPAGPMDYQWNLTTENQVTQHINDLVERDYLLRLDAEDSTVAGDVELVFKHNLERELIANSTEAAKLGRLHRLAAQWIESRSEARSDEQLEFLGQLYERGGDNRRAAYSYIAGGDQARQRFANEQAVDLYHQGLALLEEDDVVVLLDALHNLGSVLDLVGKTEEAQIQFTKMLRYAWLFDHRAKGGAAHNRLARIHRRLGEYDKAMAHLGTSQLLFEEAADKRGIAGSLDDMGQVHWLRGAYSQALEFHRQALAIRRALGNARSVALSLANIGRVHHETGAFSAATSQFREALELRRNIGDRPGEIQSLCDLGGVQSADGAHEKALQTYSEAKAIAVEIGDKLALVGVLAGQGTSLSAMGQYSDAIEVLLEGKSVAQRLGHRLGASECHLHLGETFLLIGDGAQAEDNGKRALVLGTRVGSRLHVGSAERVLAEAVMMMEQSPEALRNAEEHFRKSVEILAGMKNEIELARTYRSYAGLREQVGAPEEAVKLRRRADEIFSRLHGAAEGPNAKSS